MLEERKTPRRDERRETRGVMNNGGGYERIRASFSRQSERSEGGGQGYTQR